MILLLKIGTLVTLTLTALFCIQSWPFRRSLLTKLFTINLFIVFLWSFWVILTLLTPNIELKIIFTKIRQVGNPFLTSSWLVVLLLIFMRSRWSKIRKFLPLLYILPVLISVLSIMSLFGSKTAERWMGHSFELMPDVGLMRYVAGPALKLQFNFAFGLMVLIFALVIFKLFSKNTDIRKFAVLFLLCGIFQIGFEFFSHSKVGSAVFIQMSMVSYIPFFALVYYAIHKMEFLNIKAQANQIAFNDLPIPVLTLNPRREIWDANRKAIEVLHLKSDDIGRSIIGDPRFEFIEAKKKSLVLDDVNYHVEIKDLSGSVRTEGVQIVSLTDVTEIHRLNQELSDSNAVLSKMNAEVMKMTMFNRRIHAVLSHDLSGLLHSMSTSLGHLFKRMTGGREEQALAETIQRTNHSSLDLLQNILSWSYDENKESVSMANLIRDVVETQSGLARQYDVHVHTLVASNLPVFATSPRVMAAILRNLISNAIKYSPVQGVVQIEAFFMENRLHIVIKDQGPGIKEETMQTILKQKAVNNKDRFGFGIGMQFTLDFVRQLDGEIHFKHGPLKGTWVELIF
ncbi:ATP-binding protein [Bdellovibrio bacteriovorus]|uniref:ATP-binding protein n=1 Tax=Bdellovibrio bacteriovorus TaxID=959 RepID=UPI0035A5BBAB